MSLGCSAEAPADETPSWQSELSALDAGATDGSQLGRDASPAAFGLTSLALPETGQRAQQQRTGQTTRWFAPYDNQVLEQSANGALRRSFDDGVRFHVLPNRGAQGDPSMLLHGGFASDGSFWGVEADAVWQHDGDIWLRHPRSADFGHSDAFAMIAPDPASNAVIVASADGQLWRHDTSTGAWQTLKSSERSSSVTIGTHPDERFEFDAAIAGRVWHTQGTSAWYADLDDAGVARWTQDARPLEEREALPMRAPQDPHWL